MALLWGLGCGFSSFLPSLGGRLVHASHEVLLLLLLRGDDHASRLQRRAALPKEVRRHLGEVPQGAETKSSTLRIETV